MITVRDYNYKYHRVGDADIIFQLSNTDDAGTTKYYGYINDTGGWLIQKWDSTTGIYTYAIGTSAYSTAWTGRAGLTYAAYNTLFA